VIQIY
jgi:hypothetical protein